jgi:hypothetical protein
VPQIARAQGNINEGARIAPLPKWKVDLVEEAIKLIEEEGGGPATAEIIRNPNPFKPFSFIDRDAASQAHNDCA